jgi:hypothetical protein
MRGDEKRGLESIAFAMDHARYAKHQAAEILSQIYLTELRDDARALPVIQRLRADFPESPYFVYLALMMAHRGGDAAASLDLGRDLYARAAADPAAFRPKWLTLVCGLSGPDCLSAHDVAAALPWFDHAVAATAAEKPSGFQTTLHLFRGQLYDAVGRRDEAVADYKKAAALPDADFAHARAAACLASPCGREESLRVLHALAQGEPVDKPTGGAPGRVERAPKRR